MNKIKRILTSLLAAAVAITGFGFGNMDVAAASKTKTIATTQECSIWTRPNTSEQYRQKKVPAGHQITVYTDVIQSEKNDGKTFYKTKKGAYILCRCCDGNEIGTGFSDPAWARMQKVMAPGGFFTIYDGNLDMVLDERPSTTLWADTLQWMKSYGIYDICSNAKFTLVYDNSGDLYNNGTYFEDWQYSASIPGYTLYLYSYPFKGSAILLKDAAGNVIDFEFE